MRAAKKKSALDAWRLRWNDACAIDVGRAAGENRRQRDDRQQTG
jgi:hypothetical protein